MAEFQTHKNDITRTRLVDCGNDIDDFTLADGEILLKVERFSFTANNVTYAAIGAQIGYWQFFPPHATGPDNADWGIVPVWGFGEVVASKNEVIEIGERCYGYFPLADYLKILPMRISDARFVDGAHHRADLPAVYNNYDRLGKDSANAVNDNLRALLNPLYGTSFVCATHWKKKIIAMPSKWLFYRPRRKPPLASPLACRKLTARARQLSA